MDLATCIPADIVRDRGKCYVLWYPLAHAPLDAPLLTRTVAHLRAQGVRPFLTPLDRLAAVAEGLSPTGFLFHMGRCGSTLVSQMLATSPRHTVISEAPSLNAVLAMHDEPPARRIGWLRQLVRALGRRPSGSESRFFIKFSSWNFLELPLLRAAFPEVPWLFLYRDPVEVLVSFQQRPTDWIVARTVAVPAASAAVPARPPQIVYLAQVLQALMRQALETPDPQALLVDYRHLPEAVPVLAQGHWGLALTSMEQQQMLDRAQYRAKGKTRQPFIADRAQKQAAASPEIHAADAAYTRAWYAALTADPRNYSPEPRPPTP